MRPPPPNLDRGWSNRPLGRPVALFDLAPGGVA